MKIENFTFRVFDKPVTVPIFFHPSSNQFTLTLPEDVCKEILGDETTHCYSDSNFEKLKDYVREKVQTYQKLVLDDKKEKVILYKVTLDCGFEYKDTKTGRKKSLYLGKTSRDGTGISLKYEVMIKHSHRGETIWRTEKGQDQYVDNDYQEMPWTPEREAFFATMEASLNAMIMKLHLFFDKQKKTALLAAIDGKHALPDLRTPEEKTNGTS
jgi:hypothetical protein